ncbi:hypothetical protein [Nocardia sp. NPDC057668]|uniref:hypothetical protein n=1 Tax=Nocardia sp. NPDC057668 TaxID=3346202 RepID=UPI00366C3029
MMARTPWQGDQPGDKATADSTSVERRSFSAMSSTALMLTLRVGGACALTGMSGLAALLLLFQPWLVASGPNGTAEANAFGRIDATTAYLTVFSQQRAGMAPIAGVWGLLAAAAIVVSCLVAVAGISLRSELAARISALCAGLAAVLVMITLVYINSKGPELRAMTTRSYDMGGHLGSVIAWAMGKGRLPFPGVAGPSSYGSARLTTYALAAGALAILSAMSAISHWCLMHPHFRVATRRRFLDARRRRM